MVHQQSLFDADQISERLPAGLVFAPEFLSVQEETELLRFVKGLEFHAFAMRGVTARRRVVSFGRHYSFESNSLSFAAALPAELELVGARISESEMG